MANIIAIIVFLIGLVGTSIIIFRKIPILVALAPEQVKIKPLEEIKKELKETAPFH